MRHFAGLLTALLVFCLADIGAAAEESADTKELTKAATIECTGAAVLTDGDETTYTKIADGGSVKITSDEGMASLYIIFDRIYGEWTLSDGMTEVVCGQNFFLHEYVDVAELFGYLPMSLTLTFSGHDCRLSELHIFGDSEVPAWVQRWEPPCDEADLLLVSTHIDDEQLFFAGILPYYAGERGLAVQVVYFTSPFTYHDRPHEQLNGLWTVGVRNYPVSSEFIDAYSETAEDAYAHQKKYGFEREDIVRFQVEMIRRFRPHVIVGHDIDGEYGHGQHIINCETLMEAVELAADATYGMDAISEYEVWDTPKTYIHLWKENPIVMDWDTPLEVFDGKTAFQVSQEGFLCHESQQRTWFRRWMLGKNGEITKAAEIKTYSPCLYGLYRTNVGLDDIGGDMFENIPQSYAEIEAEEIRRQEEALAEAEKKRQEEENSAEQLMTSAEDGDGNSSGGDNSPGGESSGEKASGETAQNGLTETDEGESSSDLNHVAVLLTASAIVIALPILLFRFRRRRRRG